MTMDELKPGESAYIETVGGSGALRHHLLDMGLTPDAEITLQKVAPMGDPVQFEVRGYELTLRLEEARKVTVKNVHKKDSPLKAAGSRRNDTPHPGVGEFAKYEKLHLKHGIVLEKGAPLTFALAGNQNCGKTTLFNQLTGSNQHVGNFPGVTVDRKDGAIRNHPEATVTDLPGIYSLSPYSNEEIVTRDFLLNNNLSGIINIVDASNIERNLYLTMQLMELGIPMVLALNMMDEVKANGGSIRVNDLERILGIPVVPISAVKNEGIDELIDHAIHIARYGEKPARMDFCTDSDDPHDPVAAVHRCIHSAATLLEPDIRAAGLPVRFATTKLVEDDEQIKKKITIPEEKHDAFDHLVSIMQQETGMDREAALANMRFTFLEKLCRETVVRPHESKEHKRSMAIDRLLTGKYTAIPCFLGIICGILYSLILKVTVFHGEPVPFVMELPNYRLPGAKSVCQLIWEKAKDFIQKAFTVIFAASIVIWFLQTFDIRLNVADSAENSLLAMLGSLFAPIFAPLGFGDWRASTALITGLTAKESVVSTLTLLLGGDVSQIQTLFTPFTAIVFLVFTLLYTPCVAAIATVKRELGSVRSAAVTVFMQCAIAWIMALLVRCVGMIFGIA